MKKTAVRLHPGVEYPAGQLAGYGGHGYDVSMDDPDLVYGGEYRVPPSTDIPKWVLPVGAVTAGLLGIASLRGLGKRLASRAAKPGPWNWEMEMLGRGRSAQSMLHPGETIGRGYGAGIEEVGAKLGSVNVLSALHRIANEA